MSGDDGEKTIEKSFDLFKPGGDPAVLRACAQAWREMGEELATLRRTLDHTVADGLADWRGRDADAARARWDDFSEGISERIANCDQVATDLENTADQIESVNDEIDRILAEIGLAVGISAGLSVVTAGFSTVAGAAAASASVARGATLVTRLGQLMTRVARAFAAIQRMTGATGVAARFGAHLGFEAVGATATQMGSNLIRGEDVRDGLDEGKFWAGVAGSAAVGGAVGRMGSLQGLTGARAVGAEMGTSAAGGAAGNFATESYDAARDPEKDFDAGEVAAKTAAGGASGALGSQLSRGAGAWGSAVGADGTSRAFGIDVAPGSSSASSSGPSAGSAASSSEGEPSWLGRQVSRAAPDAWHATRSEYRDVRDSMTGDEAVTAGRDFWSNVSGVPASAGVGGAANAYDEMYLTGDESDRTQESVADGLPGSPKGDA